MIFRPFSQVLGGFGRILADLINKHKHKAWRDFLSRSTQLPGKTFCFLSEGRRKREEPQMFPVTRCDEDK
jgi:hypothetical protein